MSYLNVRNEALSLDKLWTLILRYNNKLHEYFHYGLIKNMLAYNALSAEHKFHYFFCPIISNYGTDYP